MYDFTVFTSYDNTQNKNFEKYIFPFLFSFYVIYIW